MKEKFYNQINKIQDISIQNFIKNVLDNAPKEFWTSPCSGTGKYHPPEDQGKGGLIRHLIKCGEISEELCRFYDISERDRDIVIASSIIHDITKNGIPWGESTDYTHGKLAYDWLNQFSLDNLKKENIKNCVRYHMGRWVKPDDELERALHPTKNELIVQITDFVCSRKCASFLPGISLSEDLIKNY